MNHQLERLQVVEFPPFEAAIQAGVKLVMTAHIALPAICGRDDIPSTLSKEVLEGILRKKLGYGGVIVSDALDMKAIQQGAKLGMEAVRAARAGCDLLLLSSEVDDHWQVYHYLYEATQEGWLDPSEVIDSAQRIYKLKEWLATQPAAPDLSVVGCARHLAVATEIAEKSVTLVRDHKQILPLHIGDGQRIAVVIPKPVDLTPADTSAYVRPTLPQMLRKYYPYVDEFCVPHNPQDQDIAAVLEQIRESHAVVIGTINAFNQPGQAKLVQAVFKTNIPTIIIALRMPYDLREFPEVPTFLCTYSLMEPSMLAVAQVLSGESKAQGKLPVTIPGMYPTGHRASI